MARANEGGLLLFDPCYEKILLVTTSEYLIASPRPRPRLPTFDSATTQSVRHFVREHCEVHRHWERTHHDFHTRFHHNDTPAVCVAGPERAMRYLADQYEDDGTGPLHLAMWRANRARMVSDDFNNYDMLRYVMDADVHDVFPDMLPQEIISAYVGTALTGSPAQRYRTIDAVSFSPTPLPHHFAQWYHPVSDADDGIVVEEIELPEYTVDEEAMMNWIVNVDVEQFDEPDVVAV
ncbi:hypothetical protein PENSPDRAFT_672704 [Peniophora sp. CONT]|nr:hypothetical protein PENSPDRAFT_672704 [Peniophora sp. CONT]